MGLINKKDISSLIYHRLGKTIKQDDIERVVDVLIKELGSAMVRNEAVVVSNLGTLAPFFIPGQEAVNIQTGQMEPRPPSWSVAFRAHAMFLRLLQERRQRFLEKSG